MHHEALQKVDFLLRHDELSSCESPAVPECVTAVRRAKILKRLLANQRKGQKGVSEAETITITAEAKNRRELGSIPEGGVIAQPCQGDDEDPSDEEDVTYDEKSNTANMPGDFNADRAQTYVERRLQDGIDMLMLSRGPNMEILQEAVVMQRLESDPHILRLAGSRFQKNFPLASVACVELTTTLENPEDFVRGESKEEKGVYVYMSAAPQKPGDSAGHFAFQHAKDAQDFRSWMRTFYPSQVVSASDTDSTIG